MKELDRNDYERVIARARRERSIALGNAIADLVGAVVRTVMGLISPRPQHHRLPNA